MIPFGKRALATLLCLSSLSVPGAAAEPVSAGDRLKQLVEEYYDEFLAQNPILATFNGDHRFDDRFSIGNRPTWLEECCFPRHESKRRSDSELAGLLPHDGTGGCGLL